MKKHFLFVFVLLSSFVVITHAQETQVGSLDEGTIHNQYEYLWESSNKYQDHRVIKTNKLIKFKNNVLDSLASLNSTISSLKSTLSAEQNQVSDLNSSISTVRDSLELAVQEKNNFSMMGIETSKGAFKSLFWVITGVLSVLLIILFLQLKSKSSNSKETRRNFSNLEIEFEDYKKRAREKEQVLARQLQDEINKNL